MRAFFIALLFANLFLSQAGLAYAATADYQNAGVSSEIKKYLCAPSEGKAGNGDLYECINRLYKFSIIIASTLGIGFIVIAGYIYMSAEGNSESVDKAKSILISTITSLVILLIGYIFLKAINPDLIQFQTIQPPSVAISPTAAAEVYSLPGSQGTAETPGTVAGANNTCPQSGKNLCQSSALPSSQCYTSTCSQYSSAIKSAASSINISGVNKEALIKSVMYRESACKVNARSGVGSCGLMQLQPATANKYKAACGVSSNTNTTCEWLTNPANATASICIGAKYLENLTKTTCGSSVRQLAAGYNGGAGACDQSRDCAADKSCDGSVTRRWECLYDKTDHSVCNTGYTETRNYAPNIVGCYLYYQSNP